MAPMTRCCAWVAERTLPNMKNHLAPTAIASLCLFAVLALPGTPASADPAQQIPVTSLDPAAAYKEVDLKQLVDKSRTELPGQRIIFAPTAIKFRAVLGALPVPQKADYLHSALNMMKVSNPPEVKQRIGLDYGGEKLLSAYIEEETAKRLVTQVKAGQTRTFYAYHVYNYSRGPALLVTSFSD